MLPAVAASHEGRARFSRANYIGYVYGRARRGLRWGASTRNPSLVHLFWMPRMGLSRFLIIGLLVWVGLTLWRRAQVGRNQSPSERPVGRMVRCHECGVYLPEEERYEEVSKIPPLAPTLSPVSPGSPTGPLAT